MRKLGNHDLKLFVNSPKTEEEKQFFDNLALFKTKLLLKSIECIDTDDEVKERVLKKVLEILDDEREDGVL